MDQYQDQCVQCAQLTCLSEYARSMEPESPDVSTGEVSPQSHGDQHPLRNLFKALDVFRELTDTLINDLTTQPCSEVRRRLQSACEQSTRILSSVEHLPFKDRIQKYSPSTGGPAIFDELFSRCLDACLMSTQAVSKVPVSDTQMDSMDHEAIVMSLDQALYYVGELQTKYLEFQRHQLGVLQTTVADPSEFDSQSDTTEDLEGSPRLSGKADDLAQPTSGDLKVAPQDSAFVQVGKLKYATRLASVL